MSVAWPDIAAGIADAKTTMNRSDAYADQMARILRDRLRHVGRDVLRDLKAELKSFNSKTGEWK